MSEYIGAGGDMVSRLVGQGTSMLADRVEQYASIAGEIGNTLRQRGEPQAADVATTIGARTSDVAQYLRTHDGRALLGDVQQFMEGRGWLMAGLGVMGGVLLARTIRASMHRDEYVEEYLE
ncbi:MAG: hypothetical protein JO199_05720 [Candidatus Eremiobacteraeota bacterium]|nr:hypothetical protein [Candidatus Eremiobacteraeota bacterium]